MLTKRSEIMITKVANGYLVQVPPSPFKGDTWQPSEMLVFNEMGHGSVNGDTGAETLVSFIVKHFEGRPNPNEEE